MLQGGEFSVFTMFPADQVRESWMHPCSNICQNLLPKLPYEGGAQSSASAIIRQLHCNTQLREGDLLSRMQLDTATEKHTKVRAERPENEATGPYL